MRVYDSFCYINSLPIFDPILDIFYRFYFYLYLVVLLQKKVHLCSTELSEEMHLKMNTFLKDASHLWEPLQDV